MSTRGVYAILHVPSGSAYIGSSVHVTNRYTWHRTMLRSNEHPSPALQALWNKTDESEWRFVLLMFCRSKEIRNKEDEATINWPGTVLNDRPPGYRHSMALRQKISAGRAAYLERRQAALKAGDAVRLTLEKIL
jgi:hypothetical protein